MLKIEEIADYLGLSKPQARRRIKAIKDLLEEAGMSNGISRGNHNEILVGQEALSVLEELENYREMGDTTKRAKERIREDLGLGSNGGTRESPESEPDKRSKSNQLEERQTDVKALKLENEQLRKRIEEIKENKNQQIKELREDKQYLKNQVDNLQQRLLPSPKEEKQSPLQRLWQFLGV